MFGHAIIELAHLTCLEGESGFRTTIAGFYMPNNHSYNPFSHS